MDDDEDEREFSRSIVYGFFEQAEATFEKMDAALYVDANSSRRRMHSRSSLLFNLVRTFDTTPALSLTRACCIVLYQNYYCSR